MKEYILKSERGNKPEYILAETNPLYGFTSNKYMIGYDINKAMTFRTKKDARKVLKVSGSGFEIIEKER